MKFPDEYIRRGKFPLHSGGTADVFYDVNFLLTDNFYRKIVLGSIPFAEHYVGIATCGAIIAMVLADKTPGSLVSTIKDSELKGKIPFGKYMLIDDVVTTGGSLKEALEIIGKIPSEIWVVYDRRERNANPFVHAIFEKSEILF